MTVSVLAFEYGRSYLPVLFVSQSNFWRCLPISNKELQINDEIRDKEIRVINSDGSQLGVMSAVKALQLAESKNLDLVKIAPQAKPPVCKIMDYGKYRFEQAKREKEAKKNQRVIDVKEQGKGIYPFPRQRDGTPRNRSGKYGQICSRYGGYSGNREAG